MTQSTSDNAKLLLGGLWAKEMKDGSLMLSGNLGASRLVIFPNGYKSKDTDPDYKMYLQAKPKKDEATSRAPETDLF